MLDAVYDHTRIIAKNDIAVFAHQFKDQLFTAEIPHFVEVFDFKVNDTFQTWLPDFCQLSVADMLAQKHAKVRCGKRRRLVRLR